MARAPPPGYRGYMLSHFRLRSSVAGIVDVDGKPTSVMLPKSAVLTFVSMDLAAGGPERVVVEWKGRRVRIFLSDFETRSLRTGFAAGLLRVLLRPFSS